MTPRGFPLSLHLDGKKCLVVGGGAEAEQRAAALAESGAIVLRSSGDVSDQELDDAWLVVQTSLDSELAAKLSQRCDARRIFFCAVDQPRFSSYSHLALARAGALTVAIGTDGQVPALGRRLRQELARVLDEAGAAEEVQRLAQLRAETPPEQRKSVLTRAVAEVQLTGELRFKKP
jgi:siroheme synthase-like protein